MSNIQKIPALFAGLDLQTGSRFEETPTPAAVPVATAGGGARMAIAAPDPEYGGGEGEPQSPLLQPAMGIDAYSFSLAWNFIGDADLKDDIRDLLRDPAPKKFITWDRKSDVFQGNGVSGSILLPRPVAFDEHKLVGYEPEELRAQTVAYIEFSDGSPRLRLEDRVVEAWGEVGEGEIQRLRGGRECRLSAPLSVGSRLVFRYVPLFHVVRGGVDPETSEPGVFLDPVYLRLDEAALLERLS